MFSICSVVLRYLIAFGGNKLLAGSITVVEAIASDLRCFPASHRHHVMIRKIDTVDTVKFNHASLFMET